MSATAAFASTPRTASATVSSSADNSWTTFTNAVDLITGGSSGSKIEEIYAQGIGVTLAGIVNLIFFDGTTNHLIDQFKFLGVSGSTTLSAERYVRQYSNLLLPNNSCKLKISSMVGSQLVKVTAFGADF